MTQRADTPPCGAYIHIPFCRTRCPYCDFVSNPIPGPVPREFMDALCDEIRMVDAPRRLGSVFIGGGTPSLLAAGDLSRILDTLAGVFTFDDAEITVEANPDDVTEASAQAWCACGVNRVSLGVQSFHDAALQYLGRRHNAAKARRAVEIVADVFDNWNIDIIFGAPPESAWAQTLEATLAYHPPHVAAYSLTYEPSTPFGTRDPAFDDNAMLDFYQQAEAALKRYDHYEISNFAQPGFQCRHNLLYWHNEDYAGFGPGAYAYLAGRRMRNTPYLEAYLKQPGFKTQVDVLTVQEQQVETLIQHFRLREGMQEEYYRRRFGEDVTRVFAVPLQVLQRRGLVAYHQGCIRPTRQGFYLNNEIGLALVDATVAASRE